jgi:hypothetical protein
MRGGGATCRGASAGGGDSKGRDLECYTRSPDTIQTPKGRTGKKGRGEGIRLEGGTPCIVRKRNGSIIKSSTASRTQQEDSGKDKKPVLRIRIRRINMFVGPPGSGSISQRYGSGSGSFYHQTKIVGKTLIPTVS